MRNDTLSVGVLTYGATLQSLWARDRNGAPGDVLLGFDKMESYQRLHPYFGATIGRFANRIAGGRFVVDGVEYQVPLNDGANALHGGAEGFHRQVWNAEPVGHEGALGLRLWRTSPNGEMGFPGNLEVSVTYTLKDNELRIDYEATTDQPTILNLTNHAYFNLNPARGSNIEGHELELFASRYTPIGAGALPTGEISPVAGTVMDFTSGKAIGRDLHEDVEQLALARGYDHNWVLDQAAPGARLAARVEEPLSGRLLEVWTDQPGLQFYSGNLLDGTVVGKGGLAYGQRAGFCLETQQFPDAPNQSAFPDATLRPGQTHTRTTSLRLSTD